jgi:hypothetical protein
MRRSEIVVRRDGRARRIQLGPFSSLLAAVVLVAVALAVIGLGLVFGSLALAVGLAVALLALVVAVFRRAWWRLRR